MFSADCSDKDKGDIYFPNKFFVLMRSGGLSAAARAYSHPHPKQELLKMIHPGNKTKTAERLGGDLNNSEVRMGDLFDRERVEKGAAQ